MSRFLKLFNHQPKSAVVLLDHVRRLVREVVGMDEQPAIVTIRTNPDGSFRVEVVTDYDSYLAFGCTPEAKPTALPCT